MAEWVICNHPAAAAAAATAHTVANLAHWNRMQVASFAKDQEARFEQLT